MWIGFTGRMLFHFLSTMNAIKANATAGRIDVSGGDPRNSSIKVWINASVSSVCQRLLK